ncbi:MAG: PAS domain S-box protein [Desulfobulbaceae bacterium]|nr:PAS domain S-box protein [Desulfobulbaceae bacterium]
MKLEKITDNLVLTGAGFGVLFWFVEAAIHVVIFHEGHIVEQIISPNPHETWMRLVVMSMFIVFAAYAQLIINQRKRAYGELNQVFNTAADGMRIVDREFNVLKANETLLDMLGMSWDEMVGKKCYEVFSSVHCHTPECPLTRIMAGEKRVESDVVKQDQNSHMIPCIVTATPYAEPDGTLVGIVEDFKDITRRKQAEETLRRSEEKYRIVLEASPDPVVVYNMAGEVIYLNPAFTGVFGWAQEDLLGKKIDYVPRENRPEIQTMIDRMLAGESFSSVESRRYTKKGNILDVRISVAVYTDRNGIPEGSVHILRDVTERKRLKAQMRQVQKMESIGTLAGGIAHDFNNLLMGIQGNVSLMLMDTDAVSPDYDRLINIEKQVKSGAKLTSYLLGYARKGKYEINPLDLNQVVKEVNETFIRTKKEITVHNDLAEDLSVIEADKGQIEQVLLNLFINAADAMPDGGDLFLKTMKVTDKDMQGRMYKPEPGNYVLLTVTDSGVGMDEEIQERIFEPFFTTKEMGQGTGLGLASVYGIIKSHHGYIEVESSKGKGTTFRIYLPASEKEIQKIVETTDEIVKGAETVLLVDDEDIILEVSCELLETIGYRVLTAGCGKESIEIYKNNRDKIDIVVLDMVMPDINGAVVYKRLKEINPDVKVLLSSGYSIDGHATEILNQGCDGFIQKPFTLQSLSRKIKDILEKDFEPEF